MKRERSYGAHDRATGARENVPVNDAVAHVAGVVRAGS